MCVGYELLMLPNKMPTKTPNREMSVDSAFAASCETLILHIQHLQNSISLKKSMTLYSFIKYSQMLLLSVKTHDIAFEITIQKRPLFFGLDSKMIIKIQLKYAQMDFLLDLFSDANSLE